MQLCNTRISATSQMQRKRMEINPPVVKDFCILYTYLQNKHCSHLGKTKENPPHVFYKRSLPAEDGSTVLIYPAVYAVMSRHTKEAYVILLSSLKTSFPCLNPEESMTDFEIAE